MLVGGKLTSSPAATHSRWTASTSSTHTDIQTPLSPISPSFDPNVDVFAPLPRPPCPPWQRKISHPPAPTAPKVGGAPQSQHFFQPHFSNQAKLAPMSDTFSIGVIPFAFIMRQHNTALLDATWICRCPRYRQRLSLLPSAFCLLPSAFFLLPSAFCLLPSAFWFLLSTRLSTVIS